MPFSNRSHYIFHSIVIFMSALFANTAVGQTADSAALLAAQTSLAEAETRQALAQAERAELLARLPPAQTKTLAGAVDARQFGAAGLARAFDLALELAAELCAVLPPGRQVTLYDPAAAQGMVAARTVDAALVRMGDELATRNRALTHYIGQHTPPAPAAAPGLVPALAWLTAPAMTLRAVADLSSLFKRDATLAGIAYGDGAQALFASALARNCPTRLAGLGGGYMGELDTERHARLLDRVHRLGQERGALGAHIGALQALADGARGEQKKEFAAVAAGAAAQLKAADAFNESLRAGEASDKSPLFTAARYLGLAERSAGALVLDVDLRLEGLTLVRDNLFSGERLSLSGVAFLWYRLHEPDGRLLRADALRRVSRPLTVELRGASNADSGFWSDPR